VGAFEGGVETGDVDAFCGTMSAGLTGVTAVDRGVVVA
jgi:hypothetical protein